MDLESEIDGPKQKRFLQLKRAPSKKKWWRNWKGRESKFRTKSVQLQ